jgi:hypothetical protein
MDRHKSWERFKPNENENLNNCKNYYNRIGELIIPEEVIHQWIFPHFYEPNSVKNYSWIDLDNVKFELKEFSISFFESLNIIEENKDMVKNYPANKFAIWHRKFWIENGTWEIPPIVIDVESFTDKPDESELNGTMQLVEGHNRMGTLFLLLKTKKIDIADTHKVWMMSNLQTINNEKHNESNY